MEKVSVRGVCFGGVRAAPLLEHEAERDRNEL
jgi:hypothetical protein